MDAVRWMAYEGSLGVTPPEVTGSVAEFLDVLERVRANGVGYIEICHADDQYPMLALSLAQGRGVVHQFSSEATSLLLAGDGSVRHSKEVELPVMEAPAVFTGVFVLTAHAACEAVRAFVVGVAVSDLGEWTPL